jgi:hypothetical protein
MLLQRRSLQNLQTYPGAAMNVLAQQLSNQEAAGGTLQCSVDGAANAASEAGFATVRCRSQDQRQAEPA